MSEVPGNIHASLHNIMFASGMKSRTLGGIVGSGLALLAFTGLFADHWKAWPLSAVHTRIRGMSTLTMRVPQPLIGGSEHAPGRLLGDIHNHDDGHGNDAVTERTFESARAPSCCIPEPGVPIIEMLWSAFENTTEAAGNLSEGEPVVVPCGYRIVMDQSPSARLGGLHVIGELTFQDLNDIRIETAFIFVCGTFSIGSEQHRHLAKVEIVLFGTSGFITEGGHTFIRGAACDATTWSHLARPAVTTGVSLVQVSAADASQSSLGHWRYTAARAVDGDHGTDMMTKIQANPWWQLHLTTTTDEGVGIVRLFNTNRRSCWRLLFTGTACQRRPSPWVSEIYDGAEEGAIVGVSDSPCPAEGPCGGEICGKITATTANEEYEVDCRGKRGTYVYVQLPGQRRRLQMYEVEVFPARNGHGSLQVEAHQPLVWRQGDTLVLTSTDTDPHQTEEVTLESVDAALVQFSGSLAHRHEGCDPSEDSDCIIRGEVASLNRNIVIRGEAGCEDPVANGLGKPMCGHFKVAHTNHGFICGAEFTNLGQHTTEGRYPLHIHMAGDAPALTVKDNAVHHNHNRGIVLHGVHGMTVESNFCYITNGHCFMTEDGVEQHNRIAFNLGVLPRNVHWGCSSSHDNTFTCAARSDHSANAFWLSNPNNEVVGNIGVASDIAFRIETRHVMGATRRDFPLEASRVGRDGKLKGSVEMGYFHGNIAHSSGSGFFNYPLLNLPNGAERGYDGIVAWRNRCGISVHNSGQPLLIKGARLVENFVGIRAGTGRARIALSESQVVAGGISSLPFVMKGWSYPSRVRACFPSIDRYTRTWITCNGGFSDPRVSTEGVDSRAVGCLAANFELLEDGVPVSSCATTEP